MNIIEHELVNLHTQLLQIINDNIVINVDLVLLQDLLHRIQNYKHECIIYYTNNLLIYGKNLCYSYHKYKYSKHEITHSNFMFLHNLFSIHNKNYEYILSIKMQSLKYWYIILYYDNSIIPFKIISLLIDNLYHIIIFIKRLAKENNSYLLDKIQQISYCL